jgi:hypothetical protein
VRVLFNRGSGQFEAHALNGVMRLFDAGPAFEKDSRKIMVREAVKVETRYKSLKDQIGEGEKLIVGYQFGQAATKFRYELSLYEGKPWLSATAYLPAGDYRLGNFSLVQGKIHTLAAFKTRVYVNSGTSEGDTGVWPLGMRRWDSAQLSVLYEPEVQEAIGLGFYSFFRASTSVTSRYLSTNEIGVDAAAHYYGYKPQGGELRTESVLLSFGGDPLVILEDWADVAVKVVQPKFLHDTRTGMVNTWFILGDRISEEDSLAQARLLRESVLSRYGITIVGSGEWQQQRPQFGDRADLYGFGEDQEDHSLYLHSVKWMREQVRALGLDTAFNANYAYAAPESTIAKKQLPRIIWRDHSRPDFRYPIDLTHPDAQKWLYGIAARTVDYKAGEGG